jgi:hypothetical protein
MGQFADCYDERPVAGVSGVLLRRVSAALAAVATLGNTSKAEFQEGS